VELRWCLKKKTMTVFAAMLLKKKRDWWNTPSLKAGRCKTCEIGLFVHANH